jgi:hypothetical protein
VGHGVASAGASLGRGMSDAGAYLGRGVERAGEGVGSGIARAGASTGESLVESTRIASAAFERQSRLWAAVFVLCFAVLGLSLNSSSVAAALPAVQVPWPLVTVVLIGSAALLASRTRGLRPWQRGLIWATAAPLAALCARPSLAASLSQSSLSALPFPLPSFSALPPSSAVRFSVLAGGGVLAAAAVMAFAGCLRVRAKPAPSVRASAPLFKPARFSRRAEQVPDYLTSPEAARKHMEALRRGM